MAISRKRLIFRRFLYFTLFLSVCFVAVMGYYRSSYKRVHEIAPLLFKVDTMKFQAKAYFADEPEKYDIAIQLQNNGFFSPTYRVAGEDIMEDLIRDNYAPAQMYKADYLIRLPHPKAQKEAVALYTLAAIQEHKPAIEKLNHLGLAPDTQNH